MDAARDRLRGYRQALATADIPYDPQLVREGNWQTSAGYEHTLALMKLDDPPTAIFCSNDRMAVGCYEALKETGRAIPDDVSVIGYDDEEVARHLSPQLTTLVLPHREMGRWAVEHALAMAVRPRDRQACHRQAGMPADRARFDPPDRALASRRSRTVIASAPSCADDRSGPRQWLAPAGPTCIVAMRRQSTRLVRPGIAIGQPGRGSRTWLSSRT